MPPRKACDWTRKLELELVDFVRHREFIWKPQGNTNHHIHQKYKAYAEFAAKLGRGFTASSVRNRWVNIRSTFNQNLRKVDRSTKTAVTTADVYVPCWPLWKPLQFLRHALKKEEAGYEIYLANYDHPRNVQVKEESHSEMEDTIINIRQRAECTDRPRHKPMKKKPRSEQCIRVLDELIRAMKPLVGNSHPDQSYWFFGKHVSERLNCMRDVDANCASRDIMKLLSEWTQIEYT